MADNKLYKVAITLDGKYVHGKEYDKLVQVFYDEADGGDGCSYVSRKRNVNVRPGTDDTVWQKASDRGERGEQGSSGSPGQQGKQGVAGADGKSAYQIAQEEGYTGSQSEWIESLHGEDGDPGVGFDSIETPTPVDGTVIIQLTDEDEIELNLNHDHPNYFDKLVHTAQPSGGLQPDIVYKLGTLTGTLEIAFAAGVTGNLNHYFFTFNTSSTAPTITWPSSVTKWNGNCVNNNAPTLATNKRYEVSVLDGIGFIYES